MKLGRRRNMNSDCNFKGNWYYIDDNNGIQILMKINITLSKVRIYPIKVIIH